jgi:hypothetical protein
MAKEDSIGRPKNPVPHLQYDHDCREALAPHIDALLNRAEAAGWDRRQAASTIMYLAAMRIKTD